MAKYAILDENNQVVNVSLNDSDPGGTNVLLDGRTTSKGEYYISADDIFISRPITQFISYKSGSDAPSDNITSGSLDLRLVINNDCQEVSSSYLEITNSDITVSNFTKVNDKIYDFKLITGSGYTNEDKLITLKLNTNLTDVYNHTTTTSDLEVFEFIG